MMMRSSISFCLAASSAALVLLCHASEEEYHHSTNSYANVNYRLRPRIRRDIHVVHHPFDVDHVLGQMGDEPANGQAEQQIVGGQEATLGEYPYFVDLGDCGGSLIAPNLVLSAAHCGNLRGISGIVGAYRKGDDSTEGATQMQVVDWRQHPFYDEETGKYDVALLKIEPAIYLNNSDVILTLNNQDDLVERESLTVMGMGATEEDGANPPRGSPLRDVTVEMIPNDVCSGRWWYGRNMDDSMMCAGYAEGSKDACQGDSGNPLVRKIGNTHVQVGIVSRGVGCGGILSPGVYARVEKAHEWIQTVGCDEWGSPGALCVRTNFDKGSRDGSTPPGSNSCEAKEKKLDFTLLTGDIIVGEIGWEIISVEQEKTIFTDVALEDWETYQTRKCLPEGVYVLLMKSSKGNGVSGGSYSLMVDGRLVEESFDNEPFTVKVIGF